MKKAITIACLVGSGYIILSQLGIINAFVLFLLVGAIPGTDYSVPSGIMLLAIVSVAWLIIFRFMAVEPFFAFTGRSSRNKPKAPRRKTTA